MNHETVATVAKAVPGVIDAWARKDHILIAANDKGARALTRAVGIANIDPVAAEDLPKLKNTDWSALKGEKGEARTYRIGQLDAKQLRALAAAAEGDFSDVA